MVFKGSPNLERRTAYHFWESECCKIQGFSRGPELGKRSCRPSLGAGMLLNTMVSTGGPNLERRTADPLWEPECCKIQGFSRGARTWKDGLQTFVGSWNAVKHNGFDGGLEFGKTNCRSSLGAGML